MERKFISLFKLDDQGIPKTWGPEDNIYQIFLEAKSKVEKLVDLYSILRLKKEQDDESFFEMNDILELKQIKNFPLLNSDHIIIEPDACFNILQNFRTMANQLYQEAIKEQLSPKSLGSIPKSVMIIIGILGFNEFKLFLSMMFSSVLTFILFTFFILAGYIVHSLNLWIPIITMLKPVAKAIQSIMVAKFNEVINHIKEEMKKKKCNTSVNIS